MGKTHVIRAGNYSTFTSGQEYDIFTGSTVPTTFHHAIIRHYTINLMVQTAAGGTSGDASVALTLLPEGRGPIQKRTFAYVGQYVDVSATAIVTESVNVVGSPDLILAPGERVAIVLTESGGAAGAGYATVTVEVFDEPDLPAPVVRQQNKPWSIWDYL